jgi:hypothetical protein
MDNGPLPLWRDTLFGPKSGFAVLGEYLLLLKSIGVQALYSDRAVQVAYAG